MCNLYSIVRPRDEMARAFACSSTWTANQPPLPAVFPDQLAPIVRINSPGRNASWSPCAGASRRRPTLPAAPSPMCGIPPAPTGAPGSSRAFAAAGTHADQVLELDCGTPKYRRDRAYHVGALADDFPRSHGRVGAGAAGLPGVREAAGQGGAGAAGGCGAAPGGTNLAGRKWRVLVTGGSKRNLRFDVHSPGALSTQSVFPLPPCHDC
jgi:hypothetical protein